ncbi:MAG: glycosyltransferase [archaeon]|nr:glycosyltransferase [archaeon]
MKDLKIILLLCLLPFILPIGDKDILSSKKTKEGKDLLNNLKASPKIIAFIKKVIQKASEKSKILYYNKYPKHFSIIIPADPKDKNILKALRSIQLQSDNHLEILFLIKETSKELIELLAKEAKMDEKIKIKIVKGNILSIESRMEVIKKAKGRYILFLETNYMISSQFAIYNLFNKLRQSNADFVHLQTYIGDLKKGDLNVDTNAIDLNKKVVNQPALKTYLKNKFKRAFLGDKLYKRKLIVDEKKFSEIKGENYEEFLNLYSKLANKYITYNKSILYKLVDEKKEVKKDLDNSNKKEEKVKKENEKPKTQINNSDSEKNNNIDQKKSKLAADLKEAWKKTLEAQVVINDYNKKVEKLVKKENIDIISEIKNDSLFGELFDYCSEAILNIGLSIENASGLKSLCEKVFKAKHSLVK